MGNDMSQIYLGAYLEENCVELDTFSSVTEEQELLQQDDLESIMWQFEKYLQSCQDKERYAYSKLSRKILIESEDALQNGVSVRTMIQYYKLQNSQVIQVINLLYQKNTKLKPQFYSIEAFLRYRQQKRQNIQYIESNNILKAANQALQNGENLQDIATKFGLTRDEMKLFSLE
ncbi:Hypothetical_protein [Hexamita inflata]|uniref:Hypothetical_protein n=1 Tax=Hexamita inflata TaxID=28002 RepID=A0AA86VTY6_9EUKA|nr:Hypothetical protein HINF_LOCUS65778 [Hexamita inflata]